MELRGPYEPGKWNYSIIVGPKELHQNCVLVVHLNLKHEAIVQGFLDEKSSLGSIKGNQTQAVKVFGYAHADFDGNQAESSHNTVSKNRPKKFSLSNHNIHKILCGLYICASDPLIDRL